MELNVLNINGQETGRKVTLNESIFGIEPNDHVIYLDALNPTITSSISMLSSIWLTSVRVPQRLRSVQSTLVLPASSVVRRAAVALVMVISTHPCCVVVVAYSVPHPVTMVSS